jgi:hypothetical protein
MGHAMSVLVEPRVPGVDRQALPPSTPPVQFRRPLAHFDDSLSYTTAVAGEKAATTEIGKFES